MLQLRDGRAADAEALAALLTAYLHEGFAGHRGATADELRRDVLRAGATQHLVLAELGDEVVGFAAWDTVYDMHWALHGAQVADIYVAPARRGLGVALALLVAVCARARRDGATFLRGGAYDRESTRRFFSRVAILSDSGDGHCSGRAFRRMAELDGRPVRELARCLPPREWNFLV
ncbi:MAG: GNAT family N-acetyltransferase [Gemmatimonadaceae bacterium]